MSGNLNNGLEISGDAWASRSCRTSSAWTRAATPFDFGDDFANGDNGILITGTAHDNVIGGSGLMPATRSSARTRSRTTGLRHRDHGQAYNNVIADSAIGTDIQEARRAGQRRRRRAARRDGHRQRHRHRLHRLGRCRRRRRVQRDQRQRRSGVELDPGTNFNAVINNWIGLNVLGEGRRCPTAAPPIDDDGGVNLIYGNISTAGRCRWSCRPPQLELLYVGWFGRAAGSGRTSPACMEELLTHILDGTRSQPPSSRYRRASRPRRRKRAYAALAALVTADPADRRAARAVQRFVDQTFMNLFDRAATIGRAGVLDDLVLRRPRCPSRPWSTRSRRTRRATTSRR